MKIRALYQEYLVQSILLILILLGLIFFVIWPAFQTILDYKQRITAENQTLENKLAQGLNAKKIKEQLDAAERSSAVLEMIYIQAGQELDLLGDLESLASSTGVTVDLKPDFNLQAVDKSTKRLNLDVAATGKYQNLLRFANALDSAPYYYVINSFTVNQNNKEDLSMNISGQFYIHTAATTTALTK